MLAGLELTPTARFDEEEKTRVGRRARPPMLLQLIQGGTDREAEEGSCNSQAEQEPGEERLLSSFHRRAVSLRIATVASLTCSRLDAWTRGRVTRRFLEVASALLRQRRALSGSSTSSRLRSVRLLAASASCTARAPGSELESGSDLWEPTSVAGLSCSAYKYRWPGDVPAPLFSSGREVHHRPPTERGES